MLPYIKTQLEYETEIVTSEFVSTKKELRKLLSAYGVIRADEIEMKAGELAEHPTYEDHLSTLQLEMNLDDLRRLLTEKYSQLIKQ